MMTPRRFAAALTAIALLALALRVIYPAADPPWRTTVGVIWHDEGAWVHNARNKALYGQWRVDEWNPIFIAPVFTGLEFLSFKALGVGVRQARLVSELAGVASVVLLALGVRRIGGPRAGLIAGALLATSYVYVMYDRAAIMEALMTALIVASWYCSVRASARPGWGAAAAAFAVLAFFTKAAAAFYIAVLGLHAIVSVLPLRDAAADRSTRRRAAIWTFAGLAISGGLAFALFVAPHWSEYRFYNWQISVTRKPSYDLASMLVRLSWFPILHDTFTRMWFELVAAIIAVAGILFRWRRATAGEQLLVLWVVVGTAELLVHDVGNERRYVFLIPALVALTAMVLGRQAPPWPEEAAAIRRQQLWVAAPVVLYTAYIICGPLGRLPFLYVVRPSARGSAAAALVLAVALLVFWPRIVQFLTTQRVTAAAGLALALALMSRDVVEFAQWAAGRSYKNYMASVALRDVLPAGTLVQGKLANGLALENRIVPIFIGHGFGNFEDRKHRDDVRYILTYTEPWIGFEGSQILDVLGAYPSWRVVMTFDVAETPSGHDRAALVDKFGRAAPIPAVHGTGRARD